MIHISPHRSTSRLRSPALLATLLAVATVFSHVALQRDETGWLAKAVPHDAANLDGHLVEWEWLHMGRAVSLVDAVGPPPATIGSQDAYRFVGSFLIGALREPLGSFYWAAVGASLIAWAVATWALYQLARLVTGRSAVAVVSLVLVASGTGFVGYLGNVDPHPYGYAVAALWLLSLEYLNRPGADGSLRRRYASSFFLGLLLCVAGYTVEIGFPLLAFAWAYLGARAVAARRPVSGFASLVIMSAAFAVPYFGFRLLFERGLGIQVVSFNDPLDYMRGTLGGIRHNGLGQWLAESWGQLNGRWLTAFPPLVDLLALVGLVTIGRRWAAAALLWIGIFALATASTRPASRELFLAYPAVYVLAANGVYTIARLGERIGGQVRWLRPEQLLPWTQSLAAALLIAAVVWQGYADLWGIYTLPIHWHRLQ